MGSSLNQTYRLVISEAGLPEISRFHRAKRAVRDPGVLAPYLSRPITLDAGLKVLVRARPYIEDAALIEGARGLNLFTEIDLRRLGFRRDAGEHGVADDIARHD